MNYRVASTIDFIFSIQYAVCVCMIVACGISHHIENAVRDLCDFLWVSSLWSYASGGCTCWMDEPTCVHSSHTLHRCVHKICINFQEHDTHKAAPHSSSPAGTRHDYSRSALLQKLIEVVLVAFFLFNFFLSFSCCHAIQTWS